MRVPIALGEQFKSSWFIVGYSRELNLFALEMVEDQDESTATQIRQLFDVYGYVTLRRDAETGGLDSVMGIPAAELESYELGDLSIPDETGWVEGSVVDDTASLPWCGLVRNGRLYVCISDYDETAGDNRVYNKISLDVTDGAPSFDTLLTNPSRYLVGETTRGNWSTVENYLHQHCPLEVVGLVVSGGVVTGHTYIDFPGIAYGVNV